MNALQCLPKGTCPEYFFQGWISCSVNTMILVSGTNSLVKLHEGTGCRDTVMCQKKKNKINKLLISRHVFKARNLWGRVLGSCIGIWKCWFFWREENQRKTLGSKENLALFQTSRYCRAELNWRIKFDLSAGVARHSKPFSSAGATWFQTVCSCCADLNS